MSDARGGCPASAGATIQHQFVTRKASCSLASAPPLTAASSIVYAPGANPASGRSIVNPPRGADARKVANRLTTSTPQRRRHRDARAVRSKRLKSDQQPFGPAELARRDGHAAIDVDEPEFSRIACAQDLRRADDDAPSKVAYGEVADILIEHQRRGILNGHPQPQPSRAASREPRERASHPPRPPLPARSAIPGRRTAPCRPAPARTARGVTPLDERVHPARSRPAPRRT